MSFATLLRRIAHDPVAQLVERVPNTHEVGSSTLSRIFIALRDTAYCSMPFEVLTVAQLVERLAVVGI